MNAMPPLARAAVEVQALLSAGDLPAATRQLQSMHQQAEVRAAADPRNAEWQRDLSVIRNKLGEVVVAAGDPPTPRGSEAGDHSPE